jgi:rhamnosyltransferase subunit B
MAKVLLSCWGSYGDLFPCLAIADALKAGGHQPVIASVPVYRETVTALGHAFAPIAPDVDPNDTDTLRRVMDPARGSEVVVKQMVAPAVREQFEALDAAADGVDVIVSHPVVFAAPLVAERRRLPWLGAALAPLSFFSLTDFPVLPNAPGFLRDRKLGPTVGGWTRTLAMAMTRPWVAPVDRLRAELGLPAASAHPMFAGQYSPHGNLALFARVFGPPQSDWPAATTVTGFPFSNRAIAMPPALSAFLDAGDPPVVFTLGSSAVSAAGRFYEESAAAVRALGCRAVLLVGRHPENIPAGLPAGVIAIDSAPHDQLMPRASAIVHQGGVGTTGQALRSGRPELVVPHAHDQPDNAHRVQTIGAGAVLYPSRYRADRVAPLLRRLLTDQALIARADAVGREVRAETGAATAAAAILAAI